MIFTTTTKKISTHCLSKLEKRETKSKKLPRKLKIFASRSHCKVHRKWSFDLMEFFLMFKTSKLDLDENLSNCHFFEWNRRGSSEARSESVLRVCEWALLVKSVSKLYIQVDLICQNRHLVSYRQVPGSIPRRGSIMFFAHFSLFLDSVPLLFHSNFQSWQMRNLPTLYPYVYLLIFKLFQIEFVRGKSTFFIEGNCRPSLNFLEFFSKSTAEIWADVVMEPPTEEWRHWGHHHHVVLHEAGGWGQSSYRKIVGEEPQYSRHETTAAVRYLRRCWCSKSMIEKAAADGWTMKAAQLAAAEIKLSRELLVDWCGNQGGSGSNEDPRWAGGDVGNRSSIIFIDRPAVQKDLINDCFVGLLVPPLGLQPSAAKCQTPWFFLQNFIHLKLTSIKVFENHRKSLIQHCERSDLRLHFEWTKVN